MINSSSLLSLKDLLSAIDRNPPLASPDMTVMAAIVMMGETDSNYVLVVESPSEKNSLIGILTERDIVRIITQPISLDQLPIQAVMSHPVVTIQESFSNINEALALFQHHRIRHLPVLDDSDRIAGVLDKSTLIEMANIANRKQAEATLQQLNQDLEKKVEQRTAALQASEATIRTMLDAIPDLLLRLQRDGTCLAYVKAGIESEKFLPIVNHISEVLPPQLIQKQLQVIEQAITTGELQVYEHHFLKQDRVVYEEVRILAINDQEVLAIVRDISDRKQAEAAIQQLNQDLEDRVKRRTAALRKIALRASQAQQIAHLGDWELDLHNQKVIWSDEVFKIFGLAPDQPQPTYEELLNYYPLDERERLTHLVDRAIQHGETYTTDLEIVRADGSSGYILAQAEPIYDQAGQVSGLFGIVMDISDRKSTQKALKRSEENAQATLLALPDLVFRVNRDGEYIDFLTSPQGKNLVDPQQVIGKSIFESLPADILPSHSESKYVAIQQAFASQTVQTYEQEVWIDGELRYEEVRVAPCNNNEVVFLIRDISDRTQIEKALLESQQFIQTVIDTIPLPLFWKDRESVYLGCNQQFARILRLSSADEIIGKTDFDLSWTEDESIAYRADDLRVMESTQTRLKIEETLTLPNGEQRWIETHKAPLQDSTNKVFGLVGMFQDVTERRQTELKLAESNKELSIFNEELGRATRLKDEFLANMSHELRTPLNAILGMTEGLQEKVFGDINERQLKALQTVERSSNHLLELINDILDIAKIESGQMVLDCNLCNVAHLCQSSLAFIKQQAVKKRIQLEIKLLINLPSLLIDERRIRQVLINLLSNAVKFTPEGGRITIEVSQLSSDPVTDDFPWQHFLHIAVIDTGIGISPENIKKLFQPFIQVDSALNRQYEGTGLGLALVKRIVELHGGRVGLTSELGVGSRFTIDLPCTLDTPSLSNMTAGFELTDIPELDSSQCNQPFTRSPLILIAEDNEANISTFSSYLNAKGYRLLIARNGQEAIELTKAHQPELILMDIQMPIINGLEAIRQIRLDPSFAEIPIIALTALAMTGDREKCLEAGANDYLTKPVKLKQLVKIIHQLLA
ncbi:circadian input kinase A [Pseudanabaena sp. lw0831]|uniref:PAS domain-containing protein n=1 Tax=Pseudanabaena sp. lw0831 TaxID=1357935 RepID=UPI0019155B34|nr:PAS domain-containing protein [Pseudanabaena sp. lw0831]GBO56105.1 circadian input kinase A [Pseudanabaena sp. lw0831]